MSIERLYNTGQVARMLGYEGEAGRRRVCRLIAAGRLRAEDHGTGGQPHWMIPASSVKFYLSGQRGKFEERPKFLH